MVVIVRLIFVGGYFARLPRDSAAAGDAINNASKRLKRVIYRSLYQSLFMKLEDTMIQHSVSSLKNKSGN